MGSSVLIFGDGITGLVLAKMLRQNGGCNVVVVSVGGLKMDLAQKLGADKYIELSRESPATGSLKILDDSINYVRRGGKLVMYRVYPDEVRVSWPPAKIFGDKITILSSYSETYKFPAAVDNLDSGQAMRNKTAIKAAITFD
ncbi:hypothetical protein DTO006G1_3301 [Penicillium roqueforti]|uniref:uncharacterized protein n=1 Tax=Penicillium roqueforti TaxID=5082 RepID=UPI0019093BE1|nr:uncharacterized protein LCP9604111_6229 [Penicillium roqueforti]KAF9247530.1 hypothetical protein LCP9604111_6229 [Penicillium roqueforti]KAI1834870.1 hypothetical protein CBS147337_4424 [Penicillium roqueforti]KAI2703028.1 hypothetical protein CBS147372_3343 [Penicillium roqueforti]KAI2712299.1 hypothetical protein CBS147318_7732 [Penicillium roqueforti]KAI2725304.1 hypothetical protein CBS147354_4881 [Penicillium roqueforti]